MRRNLDIFVIFKFANVQSVVEQIYPEISGVIKEEDFKNVFEYATLNKHDALIYCEVDIIEYILHDYFLRQAEEWKNKRIESYLLDM